MCEREEYTSEDIAMHIMIGWLVTSIIFCICMFVMVSSAEAQSVLTPYQKAVLDRYYLGTNSQISGALIVDGSISTGKLDFAVVSYEDYTNFYSVFLVHTNNPSSHHIRFANSEETDQVFTNWLDTSSVVLAESDPVFTNWLDTNTYVDIYFTSGMLIESSAWEQVNMTQDYWYVINVWTQDTISPYISNQSTGFVVNLPAGRTADVVVIVSGSSSIDSVDKDISHAIWINDTRSHPNYQGIRRTYGQDKWGSFSVVEPHELVDGDIVSFKVVNRDSSMSGGKKMTISSGTFTIQGYVKK